MNIDVDPQVRNGIVIALWLPLVLVLLAIGIGAVGIAARLAASGDVPVGEIPVGETELVAAGAALAWLYLTLLNATLGTETVEAAQGQLQEATGDGGGSEGGEE